MVSGCGLPIQHAAQIKRCMRVDIGTAVDRNLRVFEMALKRYFALGSVPTRVSTLSEKE